MIQRVAVLGAGAMGSQIAGHIANAGLPVLLLDLSHEIAEAGVRALHKMSPPPLFVPERARQIGIGSFAADLARIKEVDWIVEAVLEDAQIKRQLLDSVEPLRRPGTLITTNTSGLSVGDLAKGRSEDFRRYWFGTHFFNPPRYLRLLEVIPTADTDPNALETFERFAEVILGKGVVRAKDTPNFIANRIGLFAAFEAIRLMRDHGLTIEEVDWLTGPLIGRPKTATFRTIDMVGLDIVNQVAKRGQLQLPDFMPGMLERKMLGVKTKGGFYKKEGDAILTLDLDTLEYRAQQKALFPALDMIAAVDSLPDRLRALFKTKGREAKYVSDLLRSTVEYAASLIPEISDDPVAVDRAMRWGFGWELGPFELKGILESEKSFSGPQAIKSYKVVRQNAGASLRDLGDGVACLEFHSKLNTIGGDIVSMLMSSLEEVNRNFEGLVIGNQGAHFSAGANLMLLMMEAAEGNWDEIDHMVRTFQRATLAIKYNPKPVVAAPFGLTLGGGCEFAIACAHVQASAEAYMGLVEVGAGLIPAGGGTTEMLFRASRGGRERVREVFGNIGLAKVSTSAEDARKLFYLRPADGITMNSDRLLQDAKLEVLRLASEGYRPPVHPELPVFGESLAAELKLGIYLMQQAGRITEYEAVLGRKLAHVLCGGNVAVSSVASEQYFLDLEREVFVGLCGQPKTLARMEHLLKRGKPLRN